MRYSVAFENTKGLPTIYNRAIEHSGGDEILAFVHDDIRIDDYLVAYRVNDGLKEFDVVGIAGNTCLRDDHVGWYFRRSKTERFIREDEKVVSGIISNFVGACEPVSPFGRMPRKCELLDGCFLASKAETLKKNRILFDERFSFHFYDLDFSRASRVADLELGTWPIALTHDSVGSFGSPEWEDALKVYREKWPTKC